MNPGGVAVDASGNLFLADTAANAIAKLSASSGKVTLLAGLGSTVPSPYATTLLPTSAVLSSPVGIAVDSAGNVYIADSGHDQVEEINASTGLDLALSPHLRLRPLELDYLRSTLPNAANNAQNSLRYSLALVVRF